MHLASFEQRVVPDKPDDIAPDGSEIRLLVGLAAGGMCHCTLPAGKVSKPVRHQTVEEMWYCISGQGQVWRKTAAQEEVRDVTAGWSLTIPLGASFQFRNTGATPLCFIIATLPPWPGAHEAVPAEGKW